MVGSSVSGAAVGADRAVLDTQARGAAHHGQGTQSLPGCCWRVDMVQLHSELLRIASLLDGDQSVSTSSQLLEDVAAAGPYSSQYDSPNFGQYQKFQLRRLQCQQLLQLQRLS